MSTQRWLAPSVLALFLAITAAPAFGYNYSTCYGNLQVWGSNAINYYPADISFPAGTPWRTALDGVLYAWNYQTPGTQYRLGFVYNNATTWQSGDGVNSVGFTAQYDWQGALAVTLTRYGSCNFFSRRGTIQESDIMFNPAYTWSTELNPWTRPNSYQGYYNLPLVGIHEFGHGFGLKHEDARMATLNSYYPNSGVLGDGNEIHPHADDVWGDRAGYGTCCTAHDVAASAYERTGSGVSNLIQPPSTAFRGAPTSFRFTISNRGTANQGAVRVEFYLSTDRTVTPADVYLGAANYSLNAGFEGTYYATVTLPAGLTPGSYYIGWIVDPWGSISESNEGNNTVVFEQPTNVPSYTPPVACASVSSSWGYAPMDVSFDASCSYDPDGSVVSYQWDFGDGGWDTAAATSHTYWSPGSYTVTLTVTDDQGYTSTSYYYVDVYDNSCGSGNPCE
jgi:hypothetical protein